MNEQQPTNEKPKRRMAMKCAGGTSEAIYGIGLIGAAIYYFDHATSFLVGALGLLKAIVWPAIIVYELLKFLNS